MTGISTEDLRIFLMEVTDEIDSAHPETRDTKISARLLRDILTELLANREAQPVFFIEIEGDDWINAGRIESKNRPDLGLLPDGINYLYTAPPAPADSGVNAQSELVAIVERLNASGYEVNGEGIDFTTASEAVGIVLQQLHEAVESLSAAPPAPAVPEKIGIQEAKELFNYLMTEEELNATVNGYNACRAAMLAQPVSQGAKPVPVEPDSIDKFVAQVCGDLPTSNKQEF